MTLPVLWQFRLSHFNDKVRWALDFKGVRHVRRSLLPGFHIPRVLWMTGQKSLPVLVFDDRTIADSTRIIAALEAAYPEPALYPPRLAERERALALEEFFDEELGPYLRRALFYDLLPETDYAAAFNSSGFSGATRRLYRAAFPAIRAAMRFDMGIDARRAERAREKVLAALDRIETELQPSGYLVGDGFSVADLTAAALLSPLVCPPEFPYPLPSPMPARAATYRASLADHRGFRWAEEMYRRHRGRSVEVAA